LRQMAGECYVQRPNVTLQSWTLTALQNAEVDREAECLVIPWVSDAARRFPKCSNDFPSFQRFSRPTHVCRKHTNDQPEKERRAVMEGVIACVGEEPSEETEAAEVAAVGGFAGARAAGLQPIVRRPLCPLLARAFPANVSKSPPPRRPIPGEPHGPKSATPRIPATPATSSSSGRTPRVRRAGRRLIRGSAGFRGKRSRQCTAPAASAGGTCTRRTAPCRSSSCGVHVPVQGSSKVLHPPLTPNPSPASGLLI